MFNDAKLLQSKEVIEFSALELLGDTNNEARVKVEAAVTESTGKVLHIKDAHQMADARRGLTALNALADTLSSQSIAGKLVSILSGSTNAMNNLLSCFPFISRKFTEEVAFNPMTPEECAALMHRQIRGAGIQIRYLKGASTPSKILDRFKDLARLPTWANGRDVKALASSIIKTTFNSSESLASLLAASEAEVLAAMDDFYEEKCEEQNATETGETPKKPEDSWVNVEIRVDDVDEAAPTTASTPEEPGEPAMASEELAQTASSSEELLLHGNATPEESSTSLSPVGEQGESASSPCHTDQQAVSMKPDHAESFAVSEEAGSPLAKLEKQEGPGERADEVEGLINGLEGMKLT